MLYDHYYLGLCNVPFIQEWVGGKKCIWLQPSGKGPPPHLLLTSVHLQVRRGKAPATQKGQSQASSAPT